MTAQSIRLLNDISVFVIICHLNAPAGAIVIQCHLLSFNVIKCHSKKIGVRKLLLNPINLRLPQFRDKSLQNGHYIEGVVEGVIHSLDITTLEEFAIVLELMAEAVLIAVRSIVI